MQRLSTTLLILFLCLNAWAQSLNILPTLSPESGTYDDEVLVSATFPEGCSGGKYWINGGELQALPYEGPITIDYSCQVSVAGVNAEGRIITDVVSRDFVISRASAPYVTTTPKEGVRKESFYVTRIHWHNVTQATLNLADFKEGAPRHGQDVIWLTNRFGQKIARNDYNGLWENGINEFKAYIYNNYSGTQAGQYTLHIAAGVFCLDGEIHQQELQLHYEIASENTSPVFSPAEGEYQGPLTVSIEYPTDGSAFYCLYKMNGGRAKSYTGPVTITETTTFEAYGMDEDYENSTPHATATYVIHTEESQELLATPVFSRTGNTISINAPAGASVKYWLNDRMNTAQYYTGPFSVSANCKISCVAYTADNHSLTADYVVSNFPVDRGDLGEQQLITPISFETYHLYGLSANGRFAAGFTGENTSSRGFIWDLSADKIQYQASLYINQLWGISNDGTAYGWRLKTVDADEHMTDDDILWGICKEGVWTEQPRALSAKGITPDGRLFGSANQHPVLYDFVSASYVEVELPAGANVRGEISAVSNDGTLLGGQITTEAGQFPALWNAEGQLVAYLNADESLRGLSVSCLSADGTWALLGERYRLNRISGELTRIISMSDRFSNQTSPEHLVAIANDGTLFGTYDASLLNPEKGLAIVYTTDNRWRSLSDWLLDEKGINVLSNYNLTSVRAITGDANTILMHATTKDTPAEDAFSRGLLLRINVPVRHLAPVALSAQKMQGMPSVKVSWEAPLTDAGDVQHYTIRRDGSVLASVDAPELVWFDTDVADNTTYTYTVSATYSDGIESQESYPVSLLYQVESHLPIRNLSYRCIGYSDLRLSWDAPIVSLPKLQYFGEENEWMAFGTGGYSSEWGIRIPASDLSLYRDKQIRTFQFLPSGPQLAYQLNLYRGDGEEGYDPVPFYSQAIHPDSLNFGVVNTIELSTPQELPAEGDLYVALFIQSNGNNNMLGVSYEGFRSGYTDLCRVDGVHEQMVPISQNSASVTELVLPLGIGVCSEEDYLSNIISNFQVLSDGQMLGTPTSPTFRLDQVEPGEHEYAVSALYRDGIDSEPVTISLTLQHNEAALPAIETVEIEVNDDNTTQLLWEAPRDIDRQWIHWGDTIASTGWTIPEHVENLIVSSVYPVTMTAPFANDYQITALYFCPTLYADFAISLEDGQGGELAFVDLNEEAWEAGRINYFKLDVPIPVDPSTNYQVNVYLWDAEVGTTPIAFDSSNKWQNGYSNLLDYGYGLTSLSEFLQFEQTPNWLMGMVIEQRDARELPVLGYDVRIDGIKVNSQPVGETCFTTPAIAKGYHLASVDVHYPSGTSVSGSANEFEVLHALGIESLSSDNDANLPAYDLQGRRVISDRQGRGLFILGNRKISK